MSLVLGQSGACCEASGISSGYWTTARIVMHGKRCQGGIGVTGSAGRCDGGRMTRTALVAAMMVSGGTPLINSALITPCASNASCPTRRKGIAIPKYNGPDWIGSSHVAKLAAPVNAEPNRDRDQSPHVVKRRVHRSARGETVGSGHHEEVRRVIGAPFAAAARPDAE